MIKLITASTWQSVSLKLNLSYSCYPACTADHREEKLKLQRVTKSCEVTESHWDLSPVPAVLSPVDFHYVTSVIGACQKSMMDKLVSISDIKCHLTLESVPLGRCSVLRQWRFLSPPCLSGAGLWISKPVEVPPAAAVLQPLQGPSTCWDVPVSCAVRHSPVSCCGEVPGVTAACYHAGTPGCSAVLFTKQSSQLDYLAGLSSSWFFSLHVFHVGLTNLWLLRLSYYVS